MAATWGTRFRRVSCTQTWPLDGLPLPTTKLHLRPTKQTFRLQSPIWQMRYSAAAVIIALVAFAVTAHPHAVALTVAIGLCVLLMLVAFWLVTRSRPEITDTTISYRGLGFVVSAPWSLVIGYGTRVNGPTKCEALILSQVRLKANPWVAYARPMMALTSGSASIALAQFDPAMIPVSLYERGWRSGVIGQLVQRYAPQGLRPAAGPGLDPSGRFGPE